MLKIITEENHRKWWILTIVCVAGFMSVWDYAAMTVILPSIKQDLSFTDTGLVWVVNASLVTFAGFLLLGGGLSDMFGHQRMFPWGVLTFSIASMACALSTSSWVLLVARAVQGLGGAIISTSSLSLILSLFESTHERSKAMGINVFAASSGAVIGIVVSGILTSVLTWRWVFATNCFLGWAIYIAFKQVLSPEPKGIRHRSLDLAGATAITISVTLLIYVVTSIGQSGGVSVHVVLLFLCAVAVFFGFIIIERNAAAPLVSPQVIRIRTLVICSTANALCTASAAASILLSFYLQQILDYSPLWVGFSFLPYCIITAALALGVSSRLVIRFGTKRPLVFGLLAVAVGTGSFCRAPLSGNAFAEILPGLVIFGIGTGIAYNPLTVAAMEGVPRDQAGIASGILGTASVFGRAVGLATLVTVAALRTHMALSYGDDYRRALSSGYHLAFLVAGGCALAAAIIIAGLLPGEELGARRRHEVPI